MHHCDVISFSFSKAVFSFFGTISLDNSDRGWPLHESLNALYQPNGERLTAKSLLSSFSKSINISFAKDGFARFEER